MRKLTGSHRQRWLRFMVLRERQQWAVLSDGRWNDSARWVKPPGGAPL